MARLSTGKAYGATSRQTSQRLLGGMEATTGAALAQQAINTPALQPQAGPVNTFQQVGAPTLGGPVVIPRPPDLPRPNNDMANLAQALGSFNPALQQVGERYQSIQKQRTEEAKLVGTQFGAQLSQRFPGQDLAQIRDNLAKEAAAGNEEAKAALTMLQAKSPLQLKFTDLYTQRSNQRLDINTALSKWQLKTTVTGDDGQQYQLDQLDPGHPLAVRAMNELIPMPKAPSVFIEDMGIRQDAYRQMMQDHAKRREGRKTRDAGAAVAGSITTPFLSPTPVDPAATAADISRLLTDVRAYQGTEQYQKTVEGLEGNLVAGALAGSVVNGKYDLKRFQSNMQLALELQRRITVGPDGTAYLTMLGAKGGTEAQLSLSNKLMEQYKNIKGNLNSMEEFAGQDNGRSLVAEYGLDDANLAASNPLAYEQREAQARAAANSLPVEQREAARIAIDKATAGVKFAPEFTQNQIKRQEFSRLGSLEADPAQEIARIKQRVASGQMTPEQGRQYMRQWTEQQGQELQPIRQAASKEIDRLVEQYEKQFGLDGVITQEERDQLINLRANLSSGVRRQIVDGTKGGKSFGQVQQEVLNTLRDPKLLPAPPADPASTKPKFKNAKEWGDGLGWFGRNGRGKAPENQNLKLMIEKNVVFSGEQFEKYYNDWVGKGQMDPDLKLMIERSGYGKKPSEFFIRQWNNLYNRDPNRQPIPVPGMEKLQQRDKDGMKTSAPPASLEGGMMPLGMIDPMRMQSSAERLGQNLQMLINNTFMPPAAAAPMPMGTASYGAATGATTGGGKPSNVRSWSQVVGMAKNAGAKFPELVAAQWALESGWGQYTSGRNNFFGQKGPGTRKQTWEVVNGRRVDVVDSFMDFKSPQDSVNYLVSKWYGGKRGVNRMPTLEEAARELKRQGYATDPAYVNKLLQIVRNQRGGR